VKLVFSQQRVRGSISVPFECRKYGAVRIRVFIGEMLFTPVLFCSNASAKPTERGGIVRHKNSYQWLKVVMGRYVNMIMVFITIKSSDEIAMTEEA
jgi:hypothetical protein